MRDRPSHAAGQRPRDRRQHERRCRSHAERRHERLPPGFAVLILRKQNVQYAAAAGFGTQRKFDDRMKIPSPGNLRRGPELHILNPRCFRLRWNLRIVRQCGSSHATGGIRQHELGARQFAHLPQHGICERKRRRRQHANHLAKLLLNMRTGTPPREHGVDDAHRRQAYDRRRQQRKHDLIANRPAHSLFFAVEKFDTVSAHQVDIAASRQNRIGLHLAVVAIVSRESVTHSPLNRRLHIDIRQESIGNEKLSIPAPLRIHAR